ncbi:Phospholipase A(1) DAD1, chloroplastic [Linum perenne]
MTHLSSSPYYSSFFSNTNLRPLFQPKLTITYSLQVAIEPYKSTTPHNPILPKLGNKWSEYQGLHNWDGLLDPLDDTLRSEILRYGQFVEAAYDSFDFDPSSSSYATCKFSRNSLLSRCGLSWTGYTITKNLRATCGLHLPRWIDRGPRHRWFSKRSSWIGYVAVCHDKEEIKRLGRRDVVIAFRGTATCMEWLENLRATLTCLPCCSGGVDAPMVESGFLSMYTSRSDTCPSLQSMVKSEVARIVETYGGKDEPPLSFTITGHSLGAALAILSAHDINASLGEEATSTTMVTVMSFGGPRVGNRSFRRQLERGGTRVLRIVNSEDVITKVPGFVSSGADVEEREEEEDEDWRQRSWVQLPMKLPTWIKKRVEVKKWVYAEVGKELRLSSRESPYLKKMDVATCHDLSTYLHLVNGFVSSNCPFRATAMRKVCSKYHRGKLGFR